MKLFCWVLNESKYPFPVNIEDSDTVGDLKEVIKTKKQLEGPADGLVLWKVSHFFQLAVRVDENGNLCKVCVPSTRDLGVKVGKLVLRDDEWLDPMDDMTDIWSDPPRKHLHVVARYDPPDG